MPLQDKKSGKALHSAIEGVVSSDYIWIGKSKEFNFDWGLERSNEVYKIFLVDKDDEILGLMSLIDYPGEYRIHLNLIEVGKSNRGKSKSVENIAGCLIAFACHIAFDRDYFGFVSLQPKTQLMELYQEKYGFRQYGRLLAVEQESSKALIDKYLNDEEE
ncbi:MAG: hypothetical protein H6566_29735 [Lewinellaceae bacterium]|nr:hypothetical protein [Lewinellaceae bacterium]